MTDTRQTLREIAAQVPVTRYLSYGEYLTAVYQAAKERLPAYSYLRFAEDLGFSRTNVIRLVITGKRPLTSKGAERIVKALDLHGSERRYWTTLVKYAKAREPGERDDLFRLLVSYKTRSQPAALTPVQAEYFSEWYHPVIRELAGLPTFDGDPEWIKERLMFPLRLEQIKKSLELLVGLGFIEQDPQSGRYARSPERIETEAEVDSLAVIRYHQKMIEIGRESITRVHEDLRDVRAVTVCLPEAALPLLKAKIQAWTQEVLALETAAGKGDDGRVVQVNIQMFPFSR